MANTAYQSIYTGAQIDSAIGDVSNKADKATTLAGYGITNAYTKTEVNNIVDDYLPLTGGTMTGNITANNILLPNQKAIQVADSNGEYGSALSMTSNDNLMLGRTTVGSTIVVGNNSTIIRVGGTSSSEDAAVFDSSRNTNLKGNLAFRNNYGVLINDTQGTGQNVIKINSSNHTVIGYGNAVDINGDTSVTGTVTASSFTGDLTGNASSATALKTTRSIWGQNFDGSSYVRGTLSMFPDTLGMNNDTAKLWFRSNTTTAGDGYSPYIQGIYQAGTGRKRLSVFQINEGSSYTGTHSEVFTILPDGKVGVGTISPSTLLHVNGVVTCTSVTQTSDESKKEKIDDISISVDDIAAAPNITFKWKEEEDKELHGGTIAQYWEDIVPYYVHGEECKTLEYSNLAMSCSIELAKEIVALKEENAMLKKELAEIKEMIKNK